MTAPNNISETPSPGSSSPEKNGEIPDVGKPESAKLGKTKSTARKKIGRPKGQPKTGGRKKPGPEPSGREARIYLEKNSGYLDMLVRLLKGKPIKRQGPTGKLVWYYPDFDDQKWALAQVLPRMIPTLASQELTGDSDNPLAFKDAGEPLSMTELARRTVYIFDKAAREADETRRVVAAPCGATAPAAGFASQPAVAPAPTSPVSGGFDPSIPGTHSEALGWVEGGPPPRHLWERRSAPRGPSARPGAHSW